MTFKIDSYLYDSIDKKIRRFLYPLVIRSYKTPKKNSSLKRSLKNIQLIKNTIMSREACCFGKLGSEEASFVAFYIWTNDLCIKDSLSINCGIYANDKKGWQRWHDQYIDAVRDLDYVVEWGPLINSGHDTFVLDQVWKGKERWYSFLDIEPFLHGIDGWHYALHDKSVLVVSPFKKTIEHQAHHFGSIWPGASIGNLTLIQTPYPSHLTGEKPIAFDQIVNRLIDEINQSSFDVAILGCGGIGLLLCQHIKRLGKPAIYLGGSTQLLFGIRGGRWDSEFDSYKKWYCKHGQWIYPLDEECPPRRNLVEGGCYW